LPLMEQMTENRKKNIYQGFRWYGFEGFGQTC